MERGEREEQLIQAGGTVLHVTRVRGLINANRFVIAAIDSVRWITIFMIATKI